MDRQCLFLKSLPVRLDCPPIAFWQKLQAQTLNASSRETGVEQKVYNPKVWYFLYYLKVGKICKSSRGSERGRERGRTGEQRGSDRQPGSYTGWISFAGVWCFPPLTPHSGESPLILDVLTPPFGLLVHLISSQCKVHINVFSPVFSLSSKGVSSVQTSVTALFRSPIIYSPLKGF